MLYLPPDPRPGEPIRAHTIVAILKYLRQITPRTGAFMEVTTGAGGATHRPRLPGKLASLLTNYPWPFKVYDASTGGTLQVRVNSGDGMAPQINSQPALINGNALTTPTPPNAPPYLACSGSGYVYIKVWLQTTGNNIGQILTTGGGGTGVDVIYSATSLGSIDGANTPPTFALQLIAQLTQMGSGSGARLQVDNTTSTGYGNFVLCGTQPEFT